MAIREPKLRRFEDEVYAAADLALSSFPPFAGNAKVVRGTSYPGLTPEIMVSIEVSLEAYRENATEPFLIWLWELKCKGNRKVGMAAVRDLYSKMLEIGVSRANGSLISTIGFQRDAIDLAKKLGISLYVLNGKSVTQRESKRKAVVANYALDIAGRESKNVRFEDVLKSDLDRLIATTIRVPDPTDPWESLKKRLKERPIHAGDLHFTRDELHERR